MLSGTGTSVSPYLVGTKADLIELFATSSYYSVNTKYISLTSDIDFNNDYWATNTSPWQANLDGCGYSIQNVTITSSYNSDIALISHIVVGAFANNGGIRNLELNNINVTCTSAYGGASILIGKLGGGHTSGSLISNIKIIDSTITISSSVATNTNNGIGGVIGYIEGSWLVSTNGDISNVGIENLHIIHSGSGHLTQPVYIGGIIGYGNTVARCNMHKSYVNDLYIYSSLLNGAYHIGGLMGRSRVSNDDGTLFKIYNCYAKGYITGNTGSAGAVTKLTAGTTRVGGLVGDNRAPITSSYSAMTFALGNATSYASTGTVIGDQSSSTCLNNFYDSEVAGIVRAGNGTALTTAEFKDASGTPDSVFDFSTVWGRSTSINDGYPYLLSNYYQPIDPNIFTIEYSIDGVTWSMLDNNYVGAVDITRLVNSVPRTFTTQMRVYNTGADPGTATITHIGDMKLSFKTMHKIITHKYMCVIKPNELNLSSNTTLYDADGSLITDKVYTDASGNQIHFQMDSNFDYYITSIGLYDDLNKLVAYAKLGRPYKINRKLDTIFVIKFDM